ncbi:MAG: helix-turn-helix domain-containing protein [Spirillospora sp.]
MERSDRTVPAFVRLAAHPLRWRLLRELAGGGDHRVRELVGLVGEPQNLVSYHLRLLRDAGLVTARRSTFDARDTYYHLDLERCANALTATGAALHPALTPDDPDDPAGSPPQTAPGPRLAVLFTCTGNSARSPMAEAILEHRTGGRVEVTSAGSHPGHQLHPGAVRVLRERYGIDVADRRPQPLDSMAGRRFDYVISLCDKVREVCPDFGGDTRRVHWSIPDPAATAAADDDPAFARTAKDIDTRVRYLLPRLVHPTREVSP